MNNTQKPKIEKVFEEIQKHIGYSGNVKINIDDKIIKIDFKRTHFINDDQMNLTRAKFKMWLENKYLHIIDLCIGIDDITEKYLTMFLYY